MSTKKSPITTAPAFERTRPRWARCIHNLGDDLCWAVSAWCHFPRPVRRLTAVATTSIGGWLLGADDALAAVTTVLLE